MNNLIRYKQLFNELGFKNIGLKGGWLMASCPFHDDENPSFGVNLESEIFNCFSCGSWNKKKFFELLDIDVDEVFEIDRKSDEEWRNLKNKNRNNVRIKRFRLPDDFCIIEKNEYYDYLVKRGFNVETINKYNIGFVDNKSNSKYTGRIIIPVYGMDGRIYFFEARRIDGEKYKKYLRPAGSPVSYVLFNLNNILKYNYKKEIYIAEGIFDAIKISQFGFNSTCCFSLTLSDFQIKLLIKYFEKIIFCYDNDENKKQEDLTSFEKIENQKNKQINKVKNYGLTVFRKLLPFGVDPCDCEKEEFFESKIVLQ